MTDHRVATREEWRAERLALWRREKELTRLSDELAAARRALPWVPVEAEYVFDTEDGPRTLAELFGGRSQLIVQHFMFGPGWGAGCTSCSSMADGIDGAHVHLQHHDVAYWAISRAPLAELLAYRERMGWSFPWASAHDTAFNFDFGVSATPDRPLREYNLTPMSDDGSEGPSELPGMSAFVLDGGVVYHAYSAHARGFDAVWTHYQLLDRAPLGRNERIGASGPDWMRRRDEYEAVPA